MKRVVAAALGLVACVSHSFAEGHIIIWNYFTFPYNQVVWDSNVPTVGGLAMNDTTVQIEVWYGEGVLADDSLLTLGETTTVNPQFNFNPYDYGLSPVDHGPGGYFDEVLQVLPTFDLGDTFTFQLRASGNTPYGPVNESTSRSVLWQETTSISLIPPTGPPFPPGEAEEVPQLAVSVIPEPAAVSLLGLGVSVIVMWRRRSTTGSLPDIP